MLVHPVDLFIIVVSNSHPLLDLLVVTVDAALLRRLEFFTTFVVAIGAEEFFLARLGCRRRLFIIVVVTRCLG